MENKIVMPQFRIGCGYDVHKLAEERKLIICGVDVPYEKGLLGHSDADVALHALMDALLGAAAMGDIGKHFPDTDERFKGADSMQLTLHVKKLLQEEGWQVNNVDVTIIAQRPKLAGYIAAMHLIELGHKRLGFISGHRFSSASTRRLEGFKQALRNCLLPVNEEDFMEGDLKMTTGAEVARQFLERDSQPTGIAIANDMMALGFLDYCKSVNLSIPQDLSVISFDDIVFSKLHGIELTTVSQHGKDMGEKAAQLILRRIKHPDADYKKIILEPSLIVRNTTAPYKH